MSWGGCSEDAKAQSLIFLMSLCFRSKPKKSPIVKSGFYVLCKSGTNNQRL